MSHTQRNGNNWLLITAPCTYPCPYLSPYSYLSPSPSLSPSLFTDEERPTKEVDPPRRIGCRISGGGSDGVPTGAMDTQLQRHHNYYVWRNEEKREVGANRKEVK